MKVDELVHLAERHGLYVTRGTDGMLGWVRLTHGPRGPGVVVYLDEMERFMHARPCDDRRIPGGHSPRNAPMIRSVRKVAAELNLH